MPFHVVTPLLESIAYSARLGRRVQLKMDALQPTGSFKIRGLGAACSDAVQAGATELVASSGGNAGVAVAWAARGLGVPVRIYVPTRTPSLMRDRMRALGAELMVGGEVWDDADALARAWAESHPAVAYVSPFDDPLVWRGNSTLVDELAAERSEPPGAIVVAVGGGGLICGVLEGLHRHGWTEVQVIGVETPGTGSFMAAREASEVVDIGTISGCAHHLGARKVTSELVRWLGRHPRLHPHHVSDADAVEQVGQFLDLHRVLIEPSCSVALVPVWNQHEVLSQSTGDVVVVVCGGSMITRARLMDLEDTWMRAP